MTNLRETDPATFENPTFKYLLSKWVPLGDSRRNVGPGTALSNLYFAAYHRPNRQLTFAGTTTRFVWTWPRRNIYKITRRQRMLKIFRVWDNTTVSNAQNGLRTNTILWRIARGKITRGGKTMRRNSLHSRTCLLRSLSQAANLEGRAPYAEDRGGGCGIRCR